MKTLYTKMVFVFMLIFFISLIASFVISYQYTRDEILTVVQDESMEVANQVIKLYAVLDDQQRTEYLDSLKYFKYYAYIYNSEGEYEYYGLPEAELNIDQQQIQQVLQGKVYKGILDENVKKYMGILGVPLLVDGENYAVFIQPDLGRLFYDEINNTIYVLCGVFLIGSVLIILISRYIVKPVKQLTEATEKIAKGKFDIQLNIRNKDEIGKLAQSFQHMAHELSQIEQMRQDFVSNVSHEIQSPLTSIRGFSKALKENMIPESERLEYLEIIEAESTRLSQLSENLLKIASLDSDHHPLEKAAYNLDEQIRRIVVFMEPQWSVKNIEIDISLPRVRITADQNLLDQVWINLLSNSIKFTPEGGSISISISFSEDHITVIIADTGIGIDRKELDSIFLRFYKADKSRDRRDSGSGLGLAIVNKIVTLHKGHVRADSDLGEGATVFVTLPIE